MTTEIGYLVRYNDLRQDDWDYGLFAFATGVEEVYRELERILLEDLRLGRNRKLLEYVPDKRVMVWDANLHKMESVLARGQSIRLTFFDRSEAAVFRMLYCADDRFHYKPDSV